MSQDLQPCNVPLDDLRHEEFAQLVASGMTVVKAATEVGIALASGYAWARRPEVAERIRFVKAKHLKALQMGPDETLAVMAQIARFDPRLLVDERGRAIPLQDWPPELAAAVQGIEIEEEVSEGREGAPSTVTRTAKIKTADKNKALEMLMRHHGLFKTDNDQTGAGIGKTLGDILKAHAEETRGVGDLIQN